MSGILSTTRAAAAPEIATVDEAGLPGLYINIWYGLWAPKDTPPEIIAKLNRAAIGLGRLLQMPERLLRIAEEALEDVIASASANPAANGSESRLLWA